MDHFLTHLLMRWIQRDAARRIPQESVQAGTYVLSYGWPMKVLGIIGTVMLTGLVLGLIAFGKVTINPNHVLNHLWAAGFLA